MFLLSSIRYFIRLINSIELWISLHLLLTLIAYTLLGSLSTIERLIRYSDDKFRLAFVEIPYIRTPFLRLTKS